MSDEKYIESPQITVADLIENAPAELEIEILAGANDLRQKYISSPQIQKLGLALAKFSGYIRAERIQIIGLREISYLSQLNIKKRVEAIKKLDLATLNCIFVVSSLAPPLEFIEIAEQEKLPVLRTSHGSTKTIGLLEEFMRKILAPQLSM